MFLKMYTCLYFPLPKGHSFRLKRSLFDQIMLIRRLEEEQSILVKEMSQHITSLRKEIKGVEKLKENIRMGCKSNLDFFSLTNMCSPFSIEWYSPQHDSTWFGLNFLV